LTSRSDYTIVLAPIGELDPWFCEAIAKAIERVFGCRTDIRPVLSNVDFALDTRRRQYHSTPILQQLAAQAPEGALKVIAITPVDLFIPILTHVYGEAQLGGKAAILSIHRLQEGFAAANPSMQCRLAKEAVHELGHTFGLRHCPERTCIMHYCRNTRDVDRKSDQLCRHCRVMLQDELERLGIALKEK
jgi:archaemetzincin